MKCKTLKTTENNVSTERIKILPQNEKSYSVRNTGKSNQIQNQRKPLSVNLEHHFFEYEFKSRHKISRKMTFHKKKKNQKQGESADEENGSLHFPNGDKLNDIDQPREDLSNLFFEKTQLGTKTKKKIIAKNAD